MQTEVFRPDSYSSFINWTGYHWNCLVQFEALSCIWHGCFLVLILWSSGGIISSLLFFLLKTTPKLDNLIGIIDTDYNFIGFLQMFCPMTVRVMAQKAEGRFHVYRQNVFYELTGGSCRDFQLIVCLLLRTRILQSSVSKCSAVINGRR